VSISESLILNNY